MPLCDLGKGSRSSLVDVEKWALRFKKSNEDPNKVEGVSVTDWYKIANIVHKGALDQSNLDKSLHVSNPFQSISEVTDYIYVSYDLSKPDKSITLAKFIELCKAFNERVSVFI